MGNIPEEVLLALAAKNSGGGSGGTSNYEDLENKPKINGETLSGNKSASDLGLATDDAVQGILDGQSIDSFSDVESALADKVDKVAGKVLSTNDYTDADKAIVGGVTAALAGKQNVFTSGDYLEMANGVLNVTKNKGNDLYSYKFITTSTSDQPRVKIQRYINGVFQSEEIYNNDNVRVNPVTLDGLFTFTYGVDGYRWQYTLLANSHQHNAGEVVKWMYNVSVDSTESFDVVPQDTSKNLVLQEDLDAALADKQDKTDNTLQTTSKTVVGGINELKSGLTNLDNEVNGDAVEYPYADVITINDAVPANLAECSVKVEPVQDLHGYANPWVGGAGKNKLPMTVDGIKAANTAGTWNNNEYTIGGCVFTVNTDAQGQVISIDVSNANTTPYVSALNIPLPKNNNKYKFGGGGGNDYDVLLWDNTTNARAKKWDGSTNSESSTNVTALWEVLNVASDNIELRCRVKANIPAGSATYYPLLVDENETDPTFAPYTNICPISGHTEAVVTRDGVNLFDPDHYETFDLTGEGVTLRYGHQYGANTYTIINNGSNMWYYRVPTKDLSDRGTTQNIAAGSSATVTVDSSHILWVFCQNWATDSPDYICVRIGNTTTYAPYAGQQYTLALGDTIYGGTVDFNTGVMTVDRASVDMGTLSWVKATTSEGKYEFQSSSINDAKYTGASLTVNKCSCFKITTRNAVYSGQVIGLAFNSDLYKQICVYAPMYADASEFTTAMDGQTLCYELATPTTIQLTPTQIQLLKGTNTISASTGQISVTVNGVSGAIGSLTSDKQDKTDYALETTAKTVVEAINEVSGNLSNLLKEQTETITADANGYLTTSLSAYRNMIISVKDMLINEGTGSRPRPFLFNTLLFAGVATNKIGLQFREWDGTVIGANKSITVTYVYIAI